MIRIESLNKYYNKGKSNELHVINQTKIGRASCRERVSINV